MAESGASEEDSHLPVETLNLLDDGTDYVDKEWADNAAEMLSKGHSFFIYRSIVWTLWHPAVVCAMK